MMRVRVQAERFVDSAPSRVYAVLADYREGHPRILPPEHFSGFAVEQGGVGAGTVVRFRFSAGGCTIPMRVLVSEPEPGRVLMERDLESGKVTRFFVEHAEVGRGSLVRIESAWDRPGPFGFVERFLAPRILRPVYEKELDRLASMTTASA